MFTLIEKTIGLRVSPEEEMEGPDLSERAGNAYPHFEVFTCSGVSSAASASAVAAESRLSPRKRFESMGRI